MTAIFPDPIPGELLYSAIARYAARMHYPDERAVLRAVFGKDTGTAILDLPTDLDAFVARLPSGHMYTASRLIHDHTTYPYYRWFVSEDQAERAEQQLHASGAQTVGLILGLRASTVRSPEALQFCGECLRADLDTHGFGTWRRIHQMPGVLVCPHHGSPLRTSSHQRTMRRSRTAFHALDEDVLPGADLGIPTPDDTSLALAIAEDCLWLLEHHGPAGLDLGPRYRALAADQGLAGGRGYIWISELRKRVNDMYGLDFLSTVGCRTRKGDDWLGRLVRRSTTGAHPLQHVLLCRALGASVRDLLTFDAPRFPQNTRSEPVTPVTRQQGTRIGIPTPEWEEQLCNLVADPGITLSRIAEELGTTRITVQKHAKRLGVWRPEWRMRESRGGSRQELELRTRQSRRDEWTNLRKAQPEASRSQLATLAPDAYQWLRRRDREWLDARMPEVQRRTAGGTGRVDWGARDLTLAAAVEEAAGALISGPGKPKRITRTELSRCVRVEERALADPVRLPATAAAASRHTESLENFHQRRLRWVFEECVRLRQNPTPSKFVQLAGIRSLHMSPASHTLRKELLERLMMLFG